MEITRSNYRENLPHLQQVINDAQFFAIDTEFTGLNFNDAINPYNTPAEFYAKMQESTEGYVIIQFGITAFSVVAEDKDDSTNSSSSPAAAAKPCYRYESFNFYLTPRSRKQTFRCQGESMAFLGSHNFDFNKLFRDGISYCDLKEANEIRVQMAEKTPQNYAEESAMHALKSSMAVPKDELDMMKNVRQSVEEFLASDAMEIVIEHCNAFRRKLVYQLLEQEFTNQVFVSSRKLPNSSIKVIVVERKKSNSEEKKYFADKLEKEREEMEDYIGFTTILQKLSESRKLIVGHNMFLDVLYTMRQFIAPEITSLSDFKRITHKMFPSFLDTKYLWFQDSLRKKVPSSALADIFEAISKKPFVMPDLQPALGGFSYKNIEGQVHDAGYDSYMTGVSFISMAMYMNLAPSELHSLSPKLNNLVNKLYILRLAEICYIDLTGKEPQPNRDHVFYVTVPDLWKHQNIVQLFRNYGSVNSYWLSPNDCYVALQRREHSSVVLRTIPQVDGVTVKPYSAHQAVGQIDRSKVKANVAADANVAKTTNTGDSCRTPTKRRNNSGRGTNIDTVEDADVMVSAATSDAHNDDVKAAERKPEQKLPQKKKLKKQRTQQSVFQLKDDWN